MEIAEIGLRGSIRLIGRIHRAVAPVQPSDGVILDLGELPLDLGGELTRLAAPPLADLGVVLVHRGGNKGKALLDRLREARVDVVDCPPAKPWELPHLVALRPGERVGRSTGGRAGLGRFGRSGPAALAAAVRQLLADSEDGRSAIEQVRRYFGGRSEVTSFAVADAALAGRPGRHGAAALGPGHRRGSGAGHQCARCRRTPGWASWSPPAGLRETDLAQEVGVPPWKLKTMRGQARGWTQRLAHAAHSRWWRPMPTSKARLTDSAFALERMVLAVPRGRRGFEEVPSPGVDDRTSAALQLR